jgi:hypothetical protein
MSNYVRYYNTRQDAYRTLATMWANWMNSNHPAPAECDGVSKFFTYVGKRFGLISEFKKLGII